MFTQKRLLYTFIQPFIKVNLDENTNIVQSFFIITIYIHYVIDINFTK